MAKIPIEPEGDDEEDARRMNLPKDLLRHLTKLVYDVPKPMLVTITTESDCFVVGNVPMKSLGAFDKASIYLLLNSILVEELAEWENTSDE